MYAQVRTFSLNVFWHPCYDGVVDSEKGEKERCYCRRRGSLVMLTMPGGEDEKPLIDACLAKGAVQHPPL